MLQHCSRLSRKLHTHAQNSRIRENSKTIESVCTPHDLGFSHLAKGAHLFRTLQRAKKIGPTYHTKPVWHVALYLPHQAHAAWLLDCDIL